MLSNEEKGRWHYLAAKKLPALLRGITPKHYSDFQSKQLSFFQNKNKLQSNKKVCENKDLFSIIMLSEETKILEFNKYQKTVKAPFIIYADLDCIIEKIDGYKNKPENPSTAKASKYIPSLFFNVYNLFVQNHRK